ncbi:hypothetical protein SLS58_010405 [Diplodia intermedia]|uniref:Ph domain-containing protein n=1 Tax=Diplodia intermedia TaxID=856260 RepID=A0ABR3T673_9PEZI
MAAVVGKYAAKKMLGKQMDKYKDKDVTPYDPYYEMVPKDPRKPNGKMKKVKKQIPDYIPEHDAIVLAKARQRAYWLDCALFSLFGQRFGWSSVIGLVPAAGDAADSALALMLYWRMTQVECHLGFGTHLHMLINIAFDFLIGFVPLLGDLMDAMYKANSKNVRLLEQRLDEIYKPKESKKQRNRRSMLDAYTPAGTVLEEFSDSENDHVLQRLAQYDEEGRPINGDGVHDRYEPRRPEQARHSHEKRGGYAPDRHPSHAKKPSRGWFGGSRREREPDLETGVERGEKREYRRDDRRDRR